MTCKEIVKSMGSAIIPSVMHVTELIALLLLVAAISREFNVGNEYTQATVLALLSFLTKLARATSAIPVPDYVNQPPIKK